MVYPLGKSIFGKGKSNSETIILLLSRNLFLSSFWLFVFEEEIYLENVMKSMQNV